MAKSKSLYGQLVQSIMALNQNSSILNRLRKFQKTIYFDIFCHLWIGILSALAFAPHHWTFLVFLSPIGFFLLEDKYSNQYKKLLLHGVILSISFNLFSFYWINHLLIVFGNIPIYLVPFFFIMYCISSNTKFISFLLVYSFLKNKITRFRTLIVGVSVLLTELVSYQLFPWYWGNIAAGNPILAQSIEYISIYGLSLLVFTLSYWIYRLIIILLREKLNFKKSFYIYRLYSIYPISLFILIYGLGLYLHNKWSNVQPVSLKNVIMIQPNAPLEFRDGRSFKEGMTSLMNRIERLADEGAKILKPDIIVLPESSVPFFSANKTIETTKYTQTYWERFDTLIYLLANKYKANVFINELDITLKGTEFKRKNLRYHNNSVLIDPNGNRRESYRKFYLLAYGEYIPMGETFEFLYDMFPQVGRFEPGTNANLIRMYDSNSSPNFTKDHLNWESPASLTLLSLKDYYKDNQTELKDSSIFLPLICYEVIIPEFVRTFYKGVHPDLLINITNDKWYGKTVESYQHLDLARIRSIEYRRWMVRSTNSGTSGFVDHLGQIVNKKLSGLESAEVLTQKVSIIQSESTFYMKHGNLLPHLFIGIGILILSYLYIKKKRSRN